MFIYTARLNKKLIAAVLCLLVLGICALLLFLFSGKADTSPVFSFSSVVKTNEDRTAYLNSLGWQVDLAPIDQQEILIPEDFFGVYGDYNELQLSQGFDLRDFAGYTAMRYTYTVLNHPESTEHVVADLIIYRDEVIAGDIQETSLDGFMTGLEFPAADNSED